LSGASTSLTFPTETVTGKKIPGLFWRDQLGQVTFLAAPVDSVTGLITPNLTLKTPAVPTTNGANKLEFVPAPGAYTWITPTNIPSYTYDVSVSPYGGPSTTPLVYNIFSASGYPTGAKMVILDCKVMLSLGYTAVTSNVELKINDLFIAFVQSSSSFGSATDTNQIIVPIPTNGNLTLTTTKNGSINNAYSQTIRVLGYIG
jgi:hypothetical protein